MLARRQSEFPTPYHMQQAHDQHIQAWLGLCWSIGLIILYKWRLTVGYSRILVAT